MTVLVLASCKVRDCTYGRRMPMPDTDGWWLLQTTRGEFTGQRAMSTLGGSASLLERHLTSLLPNRRASDELAMLAAFRDLGFVCPTHDQVCATEGVVNRPSANPEDAVCDGRCMAARGPICECRVCGGANHGAAYALTPPGAAQVPVPN